MKFILESIKKIPIWNYNPVILSLLDNITSLRVYLKLFIYIFFILKSILVFAETVESLNYCVINFSSPQFNKSYSCSATLLDINDNTGNFATTYHCLNSDFFIKYRDNFNGKFFCGKKTHFITGSIDYNLQSSIPKLNLDYNTTQIINNLEISNDPLIYFNGKITQKTPENLSGEFSKIQIYDKNPTELLTNLNSTCYFNNNNFFDQKKSLQFQKMYLIF